jgi:hypothetical protein
VVRPVRSPASRGARSPAAALEVGDCRNAHAIAIRNLFQRLALAHAVDDARAVGEPQASAWGDAIGVPESIRAR